MSSRLVKHMKGMVANNVTAEGLMYNDWLAVSPLQTKCTERLAHFIQMEEEAYMIQHPEIIAMLKILVDKCLHHTRRKHTLEIAGTLFTQPFEELDKAIREVLKSPPEGPYYDPELRKEGKFDFGSLETYLSEAILEFYPLMPQSRTRTVPETPNTVSSSFISLISSDTTLPTPEPEPIPDPTLSQILFKMVENCMDKATASRLTDEIILYDTAYVEVMKLVEEAMEIPVICIREEIADLLGQACAQFNDILDERARIAAEIAWDRRMRKKLKRSIRRQENFRGYKTPPTPTSSLPSSHASYRIPPQKPCKCHPQWTYNRYPKDRFGIYMPLERNYHATSITVSPVMSSTEFNTEEEVLREEDNKVIIQETQILRTDNTEV